MGELRSCSVGVWGTFETGIFADALVPRILRRELNARMPNVEITTFAPFGCKHPTPSDGGEPARPLGRWSPERAAAVAADLDCIIVSCTDLLPDHDLLARSYGVEQPILDELDPGSWFVEGPGAEAERLCPVVWQAVRVSPDLSAEATDRIRSTGSRRAVFTADPLVLAPRLFSPDLLAKRLDYLWLMGWYPPEGAAVVIEGDATVLPGVPSLGDALSEFLASEPDLKIVLAELGSPGDGQFASALAALLPPGSFYRLPRCAGLEDVTAAIANCAIFAGGSQRAGLVAQAFGRALVTLDPAATPTVEDFERARQADPALADSRSAAAEADAELDRIAEIAIAATLARTTKEAPMPDTKRLNEAEDALGHLQVAHEARSRRLATERMVFANHLHKAEAEISRLKEETARLLEELALAGGRVLEAEARTHAEAESRHALAEELAALRATRTFRYTAELRSVYGRLRQMSEKPPEKASGNGG